MCFGKSVSHLYEKHDIVQFLIDKKDRCDGNIPVILGIAFINTYTVLFSLETISFLVVYDYFIFMECYISESRILFVYFSGLDILHCSVKTIGHCEWIRMPEVRTVAIVSGYLCSD